MIQPSYARARKSPRHTGLARSACNTLVLAILAASMLTSGCKRVHESKIADEHRTLGTIRLGNTEVEVKVRATIIGWHYTAGVDCGDFGCNWAPARDSMLVGYDLYLLRNGSFGGKIVGDAEWTLQENDRERARALYEHLPLDWCQADDRLAFRLYDPQAKMLEPWRLLVPLEEGALVGWVPIDTDSCSEVLDWTSSGEAWIRDYAHGSSVCGALFQQGHYEDGVRCHLRSEGGAWGRSNRGRRGIDRQGDFEFDDALLAVLAPGSTADRSRLAPYKVMRNLDEIGAPARVSKLARDIAVDCGENCLPWQLELAASVAAEEGDSDWCARLVEQIDVHLDSPGALHAAVAAAVLGEVGECAPDDVLAPRMRRALLRAPETAPEQWIRPCLGRYRYPETWCPTRDLAIAREKMRRCPPEYQTGNNYSCETLPRLAGKWMASRSRGKTCDEEGMAQVRELLAAGLSGDVPWEDPVADSVLVALAGCDQEAFAATISSLSEQGSWTHGEQRQAQARYFPYCEVILSHPTEPMRKWIRRCLDLDQQTDQ